MSGEKQNDRERIDKTTRHLIEKGGLPPALAEKRAKEARLRNSQRENGERK